MPYLFVFRILAEPGEGTVERLRPCRVSYLATLFEGSLFRVQYSGEVEELPNMIGVGALPADFEQVILKCPVITYSRNHREKAHLK